MDKREALELCEEMWLWLSKNVGRGKRDWPRLEYNGGDVPGMNFGCPCCQFAGWSFASEGLRCTECPIPDLAWTNEPRDCLPPCTEADSPFKLWTKSIDMTMNAAQVAALARAELDKMEVV